MRSFLRSVGRAKTWLLVLAIVALALAAYLPFQSASLDDFDSFNFARALREFRPAVGTPHAPGYVFYVGLSRLMFRLTGDARIALTLLSALCAALACGVLFVIADILFSRSVALVASALVLLTPVMWLNAEKALSDAPGLLFQTVSFLFIALAVKRRTPLWIAALCLGIAAGFRPQGIFGAALALLVAGVWLRAQGRTWLGCGAAIIISTSAWLLPLLAAFGWSLSALRGYLGGATGFVASEESLFATSLTVRSLMTRWQSVWFWSSQAVFAPLADGLRALLFVSTLVLVAYACLRRRNEISVWLCLAWLAPQLALQLLFLNPSLTRYLLALLFPTAILVATGLCFRLRSRFALGIALLFAALIGPATVPLIRQLHTELSPPEKLAAYVAARFGAPQALIVARQSYNALAYHLPGWDVRFLDYYGTTALEEEFARTAATYIVIADPEGLQPGEQFVEIETRSFERDPQIHAKHARVEVSIYGRTSDLAPRDFALPDNNTIMVGTDQDARYVLGGWYRREEIGGTPARWTGAESTATLRFFLPQGATRLTIRALSFPPDQVLQVLCNGQFVAETPVPQTWSDLILALPTSCFPSEGTAVLGLRPTVLKAPAGDGQSTDRRTLGIAVTQVRVLP